MRRGRHTLCARLLPFLGVGILASCAAVPISPNPASTPPWTNYTIGQLKNAPTGAAMVKWLGHASIQRGYKMLMPVKVVGIGEQPPSAGVWAAGYSYHGPCTGGRYVVT